PASHRSSGATAMSRRRLGGLAASGAVLGTGALLTAPSPGAEARERDQLANPGFAEGLSRWRLSGQSSSAQVRAAGGRPHVLHLEPAAGQEVAVSQRVVVGRGGERTLRALVRAGGDGRAASLELRSRNRTDRVHVPVTGAEDGWLELAVSAPAARIRSASGGSGWVRSTDTARRCGPGRWPGGSAARAWTCWSTSTIRAGGRIAVRSMWPRRGRSTSPDSWRMPSPSTPAPP